MHREALEEPSAIISDGRTYERAYEYVEIVPLLKRSKLSDLRCISSPDIALPAAQDNCEKVTVEVARKAKPVIRPVGIRRILAA